MDSDLRGDYVSTIEAIFAIPQATKATPMLIWSLCYHGQMVYMAKNGRVAGQHSHKVTYTFRPQIVLPPMVIPSYFVLEGPLFKVINPHIPC